VRRQRRLQRRVELRARRDLHLGAHGGQAGLRLGVTGGPLGVALAAGGGMSDLDRLVARVLLIHEYRRIVLRDPLLPAEILPADWPGAAARALCAEIYGALVEGSERWLDAHAVNEHGPLPPPGADLRQRFQA
jgi:phenylacetic acid degradation operon negative regulatory protein